MLRFTLPKRHLFLLPVIALLCIAACRKDRPGPSLPEETHTGAGTFGCKVNGKIKILQAPDVDAYYQYFNLGGPHGRGHFFGLTAKTNNWLLIIVSDSVKFKENETYSLNHYPHTSGAVSGIYTEDHKEHFCNPSMQGGLKITHLDLINTTISGTFWFDAVDTASGEVVQVREGRFDMPFTQ